MKKIVLLMFLFCTYYTQAQISKNFKETPLEEVLNELSKTHKLLFSFSNEIVKNIKVTLDIDNSSLDEILVHLKALTNLEFKKISERQVIISYPNNKVEICGYLFDNITNEPLPFASVFLVSKKTGTITNEKGFFQLGDISLDEKISIQYIGYTNKTINASFFKMSTCPRIPLLSKTTSLNEVLIVEYITKGIDKNIDGSFTITNEELGILPGHSEPDVLQSIQLVPGIHSPDESASGIQIRGGSPDQNLILWDDIKMYNTGHFFGMISVFNPNIIKDAKIFKGGADPKYGDRISGIIDISSDRKVPEKLNGGVGINGTHADMFLKIPITNTIGIVLSGRRSYTDFLETPTYTALSKKVFQNTKIIEVLNPLPLEMDDDDDDEILEKIGKNNFFFYDASAKLILDVTKNDKVMVSSIYTNNDLAFEINDDEDVITDDLEIKNEGISFSWKGTKKNHFHHSLKAYYSRYNSDYLFTERQELIIENQSVRKNTVKDIGVDLNITYDFNSKNFLTFGYQYSDNDVFYTITKESEFETPINESNTINNKTNSIYTNYKIIPENKSFINIGLRTSHYSIINKLYLEPRVNIEYPLTKSLRVKATGELRHQPISQLVEFEETQLRLENNLWVYTNNKIPILESTQFSGGLLFSENDWNFEIDGYYKNINGLTSITNGFNVINSDLSIGESMIYGIDILLKKRFKDFRTWLGYTFNDIEYTFPEIQETPFPGNNDITHNFRTSNSYTFKNWELSIGWLWRSGAPFTDADLVNEEILYKNTNTGRLPAYHRLDVSTIYRFNIKGWKGSLGVSIQNIYNRKVPLSVSYRLDDNSNNGEIELNKLQQKSIGITPNAFFRISF
ncbi:carboxypeptidase-like regulatory domain-containing protein [Aquimarina muelleri]|uniref:TonB-dependent receptor n=1 Tax=Aquimarina muelleri TaxID=279356 RepID=A0A918K0D8_9FLAO|nr:carboxypeptidase-like regulatory domain-containing protein [Aquimarina muelleri]MCX2763750.1 carboxypeptidase-like regulatory domain-containing protein [Aquimarina muelleri]GGX29761.1 TonB-dependent receptor [Aquimarina muelleri]